MSVGRLVVCSFDCGEYGSGDMVSIRNMVVML